MAVSRAERRASRRERVARALGETLADPALAQLAVTDWRDARVAADALRD